MTSVRIGAHFITAVAILDGGPCSKPVQSFLKHHLQFTNSFQAMGEEVICKFSSKTESSVDLLPFLVNTGVVMGDIRGYLARGTCVFAFRCLYAVLNKSRVDGNNTMGTNYDLVVKTVSYVHMFCLEK